MLYGYTIKDRRFGNGGMQEKSFETLSSVIWGERSSTKDLTGSKWMFIELGKGKRKNWWEKEDKKREKKEPTYYRE